MRDFNDCIALVFQHVHSANLSVCLSVYDAGNIPPEICSLSFLTVLVLAGNELSGERNEHDVHNSQETMRRISKDYRSFYSEEKNPT